MAKTETSGQELDTHAISAAQGPVASPQPQTSPSVQGRADTGTPSAPGGRTVPSSLTTGSVWLRYSTEPPGAGACESSTEV